MKASGESLPGGAQLPDAPLPEASLPDAPAGTPLYVHLPFCKSKCHYCDFFSLPDEGQDVEGMVDDMLAEARLRAPRAPITVFFGGGTPSLLSVDSWRRLADGLEEATGFRGSAREVTAECNPESLDEEKAAVLLAVGVPRLSIGFQSLRDDRLAMFGRVHDAAASFRAFAAARSAGVERLNVDLIYGLPEQGLGEWEDELRRVLDLGPDSFSAYNLTYEEGTAFERWRAEGRLARLPEDLELAMFEATRQIAREYGFDAYEISNFARPGAECLHNQNYWRNGAYLGIGPSAVSRVGPTRAGNPRSLGAWRRSIALGGREFAWTETLQPRHRLAETWWLGLRTREGVDPAAARRASGWDQEGDPAIALATELCGHGLLEQQSDERWHLTARGLPLADAVATRFLRDLG